MQFTMITRSTPDMATIERAVSELDPAALLDFDAHASIVRISSVATETELLACLQQADVGVEAEQLVRLPSECCGGCSG